MRTPSLPHAAGHVPALLAGALLTAVAAQGSVPIPDSSVPQSLQTLAVVLVGGVLGPVRGGLAMLLYIGVGAAGLPVFADGGSGLARLWGPTGGYLVGFVAGAALVGWWVHRGPRTTSTGRAFLGLSAGMALAHLLILALGWTRLAALIGPGEALAQGVTPFLWGGVVKSVIAAAMLVVWGRSGSRWRPGEARPPEGSEPVEPGTPPV